MFFRGSAKAHHPAPIFFSEWRLCVVFLRSPPPTVTEMVINGLEEHLPCQKAGNSWKFHFHVCFIIKYIQNFVAVYQVRSLPRRLTGARATSNASVASLRRGPSTLDSKVPAFLTQLQAVLLQTGGDDEQLDGSDDFWGHFKIYLMI